MGLTRLLTILSILWVLWFLFRNWQRKQEQRELARREQAQIKAGGQQTGKQVGKPAERIVRCAYCQVHLPEHAALRSGEDWFCTPAHKQAGLTKTGNESTHNSTPNSSQNDDVS